MMTVILGYREVLEHCFSSREQVKLYQRVPSARMWEIVRAICETSDPIIRCCILSQRDEKWLISEAVEKLNKLYMHYAALPSIEKTAVEQPIFGPQLSLDKIGVAHVLKNSLVQVLKPLFEFQELHGIYFHQYLALIVKPEVKTLRENLNEVVHLQPSGRPCISCKI